MTSSAPMSSWLPPAMMDSLAKVGADSGKYMGTFADLDAKSAKIADLKTALDRAQRQHAKLKASRMDVLEAIRQGAADDDRHGVIHVGTFHLVFDID